MGGGGKGGGGSQTKNYFGTVGAVVCAGPVDELVALILDGATVWPTNTQWNDAVVDVPVITVKRQSNKATITFGVPHGLKHGDKFVVAGMADSSFNEATPVVPTKLSAYKIEWANTGSNVAETAVAQGTMSKVTHYQAGALVVWLGGAWQANSTHYATAATAPPNATYWTAYSLKRATASDPAVLTVPGFGTAYFHWGTATQISSFWLPGHPPYRRQAVLVLKDFLFGTERQGPPNVEVLVRRQPVQTVAGSLNDLDAEGQANPLAVAADVVTDAVFGLGLADSACEAVSWASVGGDLAGASGQAYLSPLLDRQQSARSFFAALLAYYDGWLRFSGDGKIEPGRFLHNEAPPSFTAATTIDYHDLIEEAQFDSDGWPATFNETVVKFLDGARAFKDAGQMSASGFNRQLTGQPLKSVLERTWITRESQASMHAAEWAKINAQPKLSGSLVVRAEKAASIKAGDLFKLTHDALSFSVVCRCVEKALAAPPAGRVTIRFENERGIAPIPYSPTISGPLGPVAPGLERVDDFQLFQPPPSLGLQVEFQLAVLIARTSELTRGVAVWIRIEDNSSFYELGQQTEFQVLGTLSQNYGIPAVKTTAERSRSSNVATLKVTGHGYASGLHVSISGLGGTGYNVLDVMITVTDADHFTYANTGSNEGVTADTGGSVTPGDDDDSGTLQMTVGDFTVQADLDRLAETQTSDAVDDAATLVLVFRVSDGAMEIMALRDIALVSGTYELKVRRGQLSANKYAFLAGDTLWLARRGDVVSYQHRAFDRAALNGEAAVLRLQAFTAEEAADLTDADTCPDLSYTFVDPWAPVVTWVALQVRLPGDPDFSDISDFTADFTIDASFRFTMDVNSPVSLLTTVKLIARQGATEQILYARNFNPTDALTVTAVFKLPYEGPWEIIATAGDWARRLVEYYLTEVGGGSEVYLNISAPAGTAAAPGIAPGSTTAYPGTSNQNPTFNETITSATTGVTIHYRFGLKTAGLGGGTTWDSWQTTTNGSTVALPLSRRSHNDLALLEAYATKTGLNDSLHVTCQVKNGSLLA